MSDFPSNHVSFPPGASGKDKPNFPAPVPAATNSMGIAGFVISLVSLLTCGLLSIFGVIISTIGLLQRPRGFAIAGVLIGLVGIVQLIVVGVIGYRIITQGKDVIVSIATVVVVHESANRVGEFWEEHGRLPTQEEGDELIADRKDAWDNPLKYESDEHSFSIRSAGLDGNLNTKDDIVVGPFRSAAEAKQIPSSSDEEWKLQMDWDEKGHDSESEDES